MTTATALSAHTAAWPMSPPPIRLAYVCHPSSGDPKLNWRSVRRICVELIHEGVLPIAPQLLLPHFVNEAHNRGLGMACCLKLLERCDEVRAYADAGVTAGMAREIAHAGIQGIPVHYCRSPVGSS